MRNLAIVCQIVIAVGVFNVWVLRSGKATRWRPAGASNMAEEFRRYGYPDWVRPMVGAAKLLLGLLLLVGIAYPVLAGWAGLAMAALMGVAILSHFRAGDPLQKSLPSSLLLLLSLVVAYANLLAR